jgi:branched-chain amino acid transport system permease protein
MTNSLTDKPATLPPTDAHPRSLLAPLIGLAVAVALLGVLPAFLPGFMKILMTKFLIYTIFAMGYNLVFGYGGMLSLGHGAFFGLGAYTVGLLVLHGNTNNLWLAAPLAVVVSLVGAAILCFLFLRVSGVYFLLISFGLSQLLYAVAWNIKWFNRPGMQGISEIGFPSLGIGGFKWTNTSYYYLVLVVFAVSYYVLSRIIESPFGHALVGIRESEGRMKALGYNVWAFKYVALIISGGFAGVAGLLFAYNNSFVYPVHLGFDTSWVPMLIVIVGGVGTKLGPLVGAAIVVWAEYFISLLTPQRWPLILGGLFIAVIMYFRGGVVAFADRLWHRGRKHGRADAEA